MKKRSSLGFDTTFPESRRGYGGPTEDDGGGIDPESLKDGAVLQYLVQQMNHVPSDRHYAAVLRCLRDSWSKRAHIRS